MSTKICRNLSTALIGFWVAAGFFTVSLQAQEEDGCETGEATAFLEANKVRAQLYNTGIQFWQGGDPVYTVPKNGNVNAVFAGSFWIGGFVGEDLRLSAATYRGSEFVPGPLDEEGNPPQDCSTYDRIYSVTKDDVAKYNQRGTATSDMEDWPVGAPVEDGDGFADNYDLEGGDRPGIIGDQTAWWVMNGVSAETGHHDSSDIRMEVQVTAFAFEEPGPMNYVTFYKYDMVYRGDSTLRDAYASFFVDADLGNATDDFIGSDTTRDLAFTYNADNFDDTGAGYGDEPPALGYAVLKGPSASDDGVDNDGDGEVDEEPENLGMTSMIWFGDEYFSGSIEMSQYRFMQGMWPNGEPLRECGGGHCSGEPTTFMYSGDPVEGEFWSQEDESAETGLQKDRGSDQRFVMSSGPFTMEPGERESVVVAIVWARGEDRLDSVTHLRAATSGVQSVYNSVIRPRFDSLVANKRQPSPPPPDPGEFRVDGPAPNPFVD